MYRLQLISVLSVKKRRYELSDDFSYDLSVAYLHSCFISSRQQDYRSTALYGPLCACDLNSFADTILKLTTYYDVPDKGGCLMITKSSIQGTAMHFVSSVNLFCICQFNSFALMLLLTWRL